MRARPLLLLLAIAALACPANLLAQSANCSVAQPHPLTEEQQAVIRGDLPRAETLYRQKIAQQPKDSELTAGLVRTLLAEQKVDEAESTEKTALAAAPQSVELLTALAEVQYRQGLPWDEEKTLESAQKVNLCYARLHLVFAKYYTFNSYYATALAKIKLAHQLDPYDPDIRRAWVPTLPLQQRIDQLKTYLASNDADVDSLRHARYELALLENRQQSRNSSCHLASPVDSTEIPFTAIMIDANRIRGWGLEVAFNDHKSRLEVDTGASGLYVSRPVAEHAGLKPITKSEASGIGAKGEQSGYVAYADSIKIGGLEFKDCLVEVSDRRSIVDTDGLIGMDVFSNFLVTLDFPWHKLTLGPLPPYPGTTAAPPALNTQQETPSDVGDDAATSAGCKGYEGGPGPTGSARPLYRAGDATLDERLSCRPRSDRSHRSQQQAVAALYHRYRLAKHYHFAQRRPRSYQGAFRSEHHRAGCLRLPSPNVYTGTDRFSLRAPAAGEG